MTLSRRLVVVGIAVSTVSGCGGASTSPSGKTDGSADAAGGHATGSGGATTTGGVSGSGGRSAGSGGATASGGTFGSGGAPGSGGRTGGSGGVAGAGAGGTSAGGRGGGGPGGAGIPPACDTLTESVCRATPGCRADTCPGCDGGVSFLRCSAMVATPVLCPAISCPVACNQVATVADCDARTDCHSVFIDPQTCGCAAIGCCAKFLRCAAADRALCTAPIQIGCTVAVPHCEGPYVVGYTTSCYEGCVRSSECAP